MVERDSKNGETTATFSILKRQALFQQRHHAQDGPFHITI